MPGRDGAEADEGADCRRQNHGVVGVDDALGVGEDEAGYHQPADEDHRCRPGQIGAGLAAAVPDQVAGEHQRGRDEPGNLRTHLIGEEAIPAGRAPAPPAGAAADAARFVAGQAAETVVAEDQAQEAVVLAASDVGAIGGGRQLDDRDPPARRDDQRERG